MDLTVPLRQESINCVHQLSCPELLQEEQKGGGDEVSWLVVPILTSSLGLFTSKVTGT